MPYFVVGVVPSYPVCHILRTFVHDGSLLLLLFPPLSAFLLVGFSVTPPAPLLAPVPMNIPRPMGCAANPAQSQPGDTLTHTVRLLQGSPGTNIPTIVARVDYRRLSTVDTKGASSVDPSTEDLCQVLNRSSGLAFSPPATVTNITRLSNRSLFCRVRPKEEPTFTK